MQNLKMYCISINESNLDLIEKTGYIPVGLGDNIKSDRFLKDNKGLNITEKNPYYGEYTFHYWLWKNQIENFNSEWIGFCQYRKFWAKNKDQAKFENFEDFNNILLKEIPSDLDNFECILGEPLKINQLRLSKYLKKNLIKMVKNPILFFSKKKRNIKFHFDMMHGEGNLERAIKLLDQKDSKDFLEFVERETSFHPHNMFICKSKEILFNYYNSIFPWLDKCEKEFGFNLEGYSMKRLYGFLAERYMSYWFQKYTKHTTLPIIFKEISEFN